MFIVLIIFYAKFFYYKACVSLDVRLKTVKKSLGTRMSILFL